MYKTMIKSLLVSFAVFSAPLSLADETVTPTTSTAEMSVNINTADADELDKHLMGIGQAKAKLIVDYRNDHGDFKNIKDLENIKGIGQKTVELNKDVIKIE